MIRTSLGLIQLALAVLITSQLSAAPLDPSTVSGRVLHLDASTLGLANGAAVNTWTDLSAAGNNHTAGAAPTFIADGGAAFNNLPIVRFSGAQFLDSAFTGLASQPGATVFAVLNSTGAAGVNQVALSSRTSANQASIPRLQRVDTAGADRWLTGSNAEAWRYGAGSVLNPGSTTFYNSVFDGTQPVSSRINLNVDGVLHAGIPGGLVAAATTGDVNFNRVGAWQGGGFNWQGDIAEVLIFDRTLTAAEQQGVSQFLANKYGVTAPAAGATQLIGLDFTVNSLAQIGDEPGGFTGHTGPWNSLNLGNGESGASTGPLGTADGSQTDNPVTFAFTAGNYNATNIAAPTLLRGDVAFLQTGSQENDLLWEIDGLIAGNEYDLNFFGQTTNDPNFVNGVNAMEFIIDGVPGSITTDDVAAFVGVVADGQGMISGIFRHDPTEGFSSVSGLEIQGSFQAQAVPEPASIALWSLLGVIGVCYAAWWRRSRCLIRECV